MVWEPMGERVDELDVSKVPAIDCRTGTILHPAESRRPPRKIQEIVSLQVWELDPPRFPEEALY